MEIKSFFLRVSFQYNTPALKSKKVHGKIRYTSDFCYSYSLDSPVPKRVCIFLRNKYFEKYGWFKGKRVYFNVTVSNAFLTLFCDKIHILGFKKIGDPFLENKMKGFQWYNFNSWNFTSLYFSRFKLQLPYKCLIIFFSKAFYFNILWAPWLEGKFILLFEYVCFLWVKKKARYFHFGWSYPKGYVYL